MSNYSKLIAAILGNIVAVVLVYLGSKGLATCVAGATPDADKVCTIAGFSSEQITVAAMVVINAIAVHFAPANKPSV